MAQAASHSSPRSSLKWDLSEFDVRQRWRTRPPKVFPSPWACEWGYDEFGLWQVFAVQGPQELVKHTMRYIPHGTFLMGSPEDEPKRGDDETRHQVELTQGFWLGETTVTQALWEAVTKENPSRFSPEEGEQLPVEKVSWDDCVDFCEQLNQLKQGINALLPTEAQWEYACRAGTQTPFSTGEQLSTEQANYDGDHSYDGREALSEAEQSQQSYREKTVDVNFFEPNAWGLKQMHGNVWEWCSDVWDGNDYSPEAVKDPTGLVEKSSKDSDEVQSARVLRGGSWYNYARNCRSAQRYRNARDSRYYYLGLRLCSRSE